MGENAGIFTGVSSLRKMAHIFLLSGQLCQLFAMSSGLVGANAGTGSMHIIALLCYGCATFLLVFYWCLPEIQGNRAILYAVLGLAFSAALFIIIGMCVHAGTTDFQAPYYSTTLICFSAFLAVGGGVCVILDLKGYKLEVPPPPVTDPAPAARAEPEPKNQV